jgi:hypothetical protein
LFTTPPQSEEAGDTKLEPKYNQHNSSNNSNVVKNGSIDQIRIDVRNDNVDIDDDVSSPTVGVVIGVLLTLISFLVGGILYVFYRNKRSGKRLTFDRRRRDGRSKLEGFTSESFFSLVYSGEEPRAIR